MNGQEETLVLQTLPGTNHCQWERDCLVSLATPSGWDHADLPGDPVSLSSPRLPRSPAPPRPARPGQSVEPAQPLGREWEPSLGGALVASSHPDIMRAWRALRAGEATLPLHLFPPPPHGAGGRPGLARAGGVGCATASGRDQVWKRPGGSVAGTGCPPLCPAARQCLRGAPSPALAPGPQPKLQQGLTPLG